MKTLRTGFILCMIPNLYWIYTLVQQFSSLYLGIYGAISIANISGSQIEVTECTIYNLSLAVGERTFTFKSQAPEMLKYALVWNLVVIPIFILVQYFIERMKSRHKAITEAEQLNSAETADDTGEE